MDTIKPKPMAECRYDVLALGEVMLRLDPGEGRIRTARSFNVWEGGGEYNVARGLGRVFGLRAGVLTALVDNEVGRLVEALITAGSVDTSLIRWVDHDGVGRVSRNGLNFTERGYGVRGATGVSDRGHTAVSQLEVSAIDLDRVFGTEGVRWLHTGGIFAALSETSARTAAEVLKAARSHGTVISYDLNYRPSLWKTAGGRSAAVSVNTELVRLVDVVLGNEEDFSMALGFEVPGQEGDLERLDLESYAAMIARVVTAFPNVKVLATSLRRVVSASVNDWGGLAWSAGTGLLRATQRDGMHILDRVGGGDSFASGLIYGLLKDEPLQRCLELAAAHGALAMTTPGDTSMVSASDVRKLALGGNARVER